jgi:rSAM/selenodomain-associated transferase 1
MSPPSARKTAVAILAQAPVPGFAKTRLIPVIGQHAAAVLQERLTDRAVATALEADVGPVTLWGAPDASHDTFLAMVVRKPVSLRPQPAGDLGARMLAATAAANGPVLVLGTDCPALAAMHLRSAAKALHEGADVVLIPSENGGYVLVGLRQAEPTVFDKIPWGTPKVLAETRARVIARGLRLNEIPPLWDVGTEDDLARMEREIPELALTASG